MYEISNEPPRYRGVSGLKQLAFAAAAIGGLIFSVAVAAAGDEVASDAMPSASARSAIAQREVAQDRSMLAIDRALAMPGAMPGERSATGTTKAPAREAERIHEGHRKLRPNAADVKEPIATF
jgi:hypothetical protein